MVDKSAYARMSVQPVRDVLAPLMRAGEVATCGVVEFEMLYSARGARDLAALRSEMALALDSVPMMQADFDRAIEVMESLAERSQHRSAKLPDLLIAAAAEREGLIVLHYDEDFDRIAAVTGQVMQWVAPRGSV
jgi:predicted nucleic acid-binding protein